MGFMQGFVYGFNCLAFEEFWGLGVGVGENGGGAEELELEDLGDVGDHGGYFGHGGAFVNKYVVFVVVHNDGLGVGGCGYQLVFADKKRHLLQSCHQ